MSLVLSSSPALAVTPLLETDVDAFASRAEQWVEAREEHREAAHEDALQLAEDARQAEADRVAAEEAARQAEIDRREAAARTTTTTRPPTTTTAPPPTTTRAADTTTTAGATETTVPATSEGPTAAQWTVLRQCESSGNYGAVSANQRYRGAYQFSQATWDWVAGSADPAQVGVDPATAAPAVQDAMARALWERQGWSPWPHCGVLAANA